MRGHISKATRAIVKARFGGRCGYCGQTPPALCVDHVHPVAMAHLLPPGREVNAIENLMPACPSCNNYKSCRSLSQFRRDLEEQVKRARAQSLNFRLAERFGLVIVRETPVKFHFEIQR